MPESESGPQQDHSHEERLKALRERLYSRGSAPAPEVRHALEKKPRDVSRMWPPRMATTKPVPPKPEPVAPIHMSTPVAVPQDPQLMTAQRKKRSYRLTILLAGLAFFIGALVISGAFLFFGTNTISGDNIAISVSGPFAVGGGEELPLQISIANQNAVTIESATLILEYPPGTQAADGSGKELFRERKQLNEINPGEALNIPLRALVFGEENDEKTVRASVEYRVRGSNATFFKEATPFVFKISSSPVVLSIDAVKQIASGQEVELKVTVASNAPSPLGGVLVKAEFPFGFDAGDSEPAPVSGRDTWFISELKPEEERTIMVKGVIIGEESDTRLFRFSVGVANERDQFSLASIFTTQSHEIDIEQPFLDIGVRINGDADNEVIVAPGTPAQVTVTLKNTLSSTLYDSEIEVDLSGNALDDGAVEVSGGFYDSTSNTVRWDARSEDTLEELQPGDTSTVTFTLTPRAGGDASRTPQVALSVDVKGRRVSEDSVPQQLSGTVARTIKVESVAELTSYALHTVGPFNNTGPIPPQAEEVTTYTIGLSIENGSNAVTDAVVEVPLPAYITWLDRVMTGSQFSYNAVTRTATWEVGDLDAGEGKETAFQISLLPSISQVGQTVTIAGEQRFRGTDRFTGTTVRATSRALTTRLTEDPDSDTRDGRVQAEDD